MNHSRFFLAFIILYITILQTSCSILKDNTLTLNSPDGNVSINFLLKKSTTGNRYPCYKVTYQGKALVNESGLGIEFAGNDRLMNNFEIKEIKKNSSDKTYPVFFGKTQNARDHYNEAVISLEEKSNKRRLLDIVFRAYDDGAAFRYYLPKQPYLADFIISDEKSHFSVAGNPNAYFLWLPQFGAHYENLYQILPVTAITPDSLSGVPLLLEYPEGIWLAITEANLTDYAGMYLSGVTDSPGMLVSKLSSLPDHPDIKVKAATPHYTPWRVLMIAGSPGQLIESNIVLNLSDSCAIQDVSWIKPGKILFPWWNDYLVTGVNFKVGLNSKTEKYYIDFCAANGIEYHSIEGYKGRAWYGGSFVPYAGNDVTSVVPDLNMQEVIRYAGEKGVRIRLWVHWEGIQKYIDKAFPLYEKWGIEGVMVDFMNRDDQEMVNFYESVVRKAAEHHLTVNFHGAYKPTGMRRTYPNLLTQEAVMNLEYNKGHYRNISPEHNLTVPFTRMLAGPLDYHEGGFRNVTEKEFKPRWAAPFVMGTRCHYLAMYVVYENPLPMLADHPAAYLNQIGFDFLKKVPARWDETKVINAKVSDYITIVRQHGEEWYVGSMTDWTPRELSIPLKFLPGGEFIADIYADGPEADRFATQVSHRQYMVTAGDTIIARLAQGGGQAIRLTPAGKSSTLPAYREMNKK